MGRHFASALLLTFVLVAGAGEALSKNVHPNASARTNVVRVITDDFVLPGKLDKLAGFARAQGLALESVFVARTPGSPADWIGGAGLVILDTPRPMDLVRVQESVGSALKDTTVPWIRVGGGPPAFGNLAPLIARRLMAYYSHGGEENLKALFEFWAALRDGRDPTHIASPTPLPSTGIYHPDAPTAFTSVADYLRWAEGRVTRPKGRIGIAIHPGLIANMETKVVDAMIRQSENRGLLPMAFWFEAADPQGLEKLLVPAKADALVIATHMQNGSARSAEFLKLGIPVVQVVNYREGDADAWDRAESGMAAPLVAAFLAVPEGWGASDPLVVDALHNGEPAPIQKQIEALLGKLERLVALRHTPADQKKLAAMFWNYPPGEKNLSASNLNIPRSLEKVTAALAKAGYAVKPTSEADLIEAGQAMLAGYYRPETLDALRERGLAGTLPVRAYRSWLDALPAQRKSELLAKWGEPEQHSAVRDIGGEKQFVIPRFEMGKLTIMPQPPRGGRPGENYHDTKQPPDHAYLATYLYVRETLGADALIHLGTHGTQEWTPGKDRGLSVHDYPMLAVGNMPVIYPYIQDNVAEAIQAKRRGRAVTVSHQTPAFAPAGLYNELRDLHTKIHEFMQLENGAVKEQTGEDIRKAVVKHNYHRDMGWDEKAVDGDFPKFLSELHDHLHELAQHAMPLGLHTFGEPSSPDERLSTVMQQLGQPFYKKLGTEPEEFFAVDFKALQDSAPYKLLRRHLREGVPVETLADPELADAIKRAIGLDLNLQHPGEIEGLLVALGGGFVPPGAGGDPIRNPDMASGRNLFAFEPDKVPTRAAHEAGAKALQQLIDAYRKDHQGETPRKLAFSMWGSETMRHLGIVESQILHALGLRPVWNDGGRLTGLAIIPRQELGRPRIDVVMQITSVYRDQFDSFMRKLADAIEQLAQLDEGDNPLFQNTRASAERLVAQGQPRERALQLARLRMFSNAMGDYGTGLPEAVLKSASWEKDSSLAEAFLGRTQYAYGSKFWGIRGDGETNLFAEQLKGVQAAVLSRSSKLHGILSTDHPFEFLGGLSLAIRHLDGASPSLYIADLRENTARITSAARFLSDESRSRYFNPHWISTRQKEGYAGTLEILNAVNNLWGWQVVDPNMVRADQWQTVHDTFIRDIRDLKLAAWFEQHNPTAQLQIMERMIEAIRKGYWNAPEDTRRELVARLEELAQKNVLMEENVTRAFVDQMGAGFGIARPSQQPPPAAAKQAEINPTQTVTGPVLEPVVAGAGESRSWWHSAMALLMMLACFGAGLYVQWRRNSLAALGDA